MPSPSTCLSKISCGSFLWPLSLSFKATKGQAADGKSGREGLRGCGGPRRASHTLTTVCQARSCRDITAARTQNRPSPAWLQLGLDLMDDIRMAAESVPHRFGPAGPRLWRSRPDEQLPQIFTPFSRPTIRRRPTRTQHTRPKAF